MNISTEREWDCVVCGLATVDIVARPVPLERAIGRAQLVLCDRIAATTGGIVSNSGIALATLGLRTTALAYVGRDSWADLVRGRYQAAGLATTHLLTHPTLGTPVTIVLVDESGERSFVFEMGAARAFGADACESQRALFASSRAVLYGYYALVPERNAEIARVLRLARECGCLTALDAAGDGGTLEPLREILPVCDVYFPSLAEARHQTGLEDPAAMLACYRSIGATGILGLKLGARGALVSERGDEFHHIPAIAPPGPVVDTTGAGDSFFAGFLTGLLRGMSVVDAARLAAAAGACCVTGLGASDGLRDFAATCQLAGLEPR